jgi:hypothetical protein
VISRANDNSGAAADFLTHFAQDHPRFLGGTYGLARFIEHPQAKEVRNHGAAENDGKNSHAELKLYKAERAPSACAGIA